MARRSNPLGRKSNSVSDVTNVNPGNGHREEYPATEYIDDADEYRGSHRRADDGDEEYYEEAAGGSTAAAVGGVPKRGLAMILIAVAAILLLWGLYALTQNDNAGTDTDTAGSQAGTTAATQQPGQAGQAGRPGQNPTQPQGQQPAPGDSAPQPNQGQASAPSDPNNPNAAAAPNAGVNPAQNQGPVLTKETAQVFIYNNSPNAGLAGATADQLAGQYTVSNRSPDSTDMNLPEQRYGIFPRTTVFYDPAMAGADQVAAEVARQVNGVVTPVTDVPQGATLPDEVRGKREAISVVLTG